MAACCLLRRQVTEGRQRRGIASGATEHLRTGNQPQSRKVVRSHDPPVAPTASGPSDCSRPARASAPDGNGCPRREKPSDHDGPNSLISPQNARQSGLTPRSLVGRLRSCPVSGGKEKWHILPVGEVHDEHTACQGGDRRNAPWARVSASRSERMSL